MKKRLISLILIVMMVLTSCSNLNIAVKGNSGKNNSGKIQFWYYTRDGNNHIIHNYVKTIKEFCDNNNIEMEIFHYNEADISKEDYILKRNLSVVTGNAIIFDEISNMLDIANQHADYTKLDNYDALFSVYKDKFCIPITFQTAVPYISNDIMKYYGIDLSQRKVLTYSEYLDIKQEMKEKGARFKYNSREYNELLAYYLNSNDLLLVNEESKVINEDDVFRDALKKSVLGICNDIVLYGNINLYPNMKSGGMDDIADYIEIVKAEHIYDMESDLVLWGDHNFVSGSTSTRDLLNVHIANSTFIFNPYFIASVMPALYIYKNITNDKVYDVANYIISETSYSILFESGNTRFMPILNTDMTKKQIYANDDWTLNNEFKVDDEIRGVINDTYKVLLKDEEKAREIADYLYYDKNYSIVIRTFVDDLIFDIAKMLSGEDLSLKRFDSENAEINKMIDDKINEFVSNFKILYK